MTQVPITPLTPAAVRAHFLAHFPTGELPGAFFELTSQSLLHGIAAFFTGTGARPACTLENIVATVSYPHTGQLLAMLATDPECAPWVLQLQDALDRRAVFQVAGVISFIEFILAHVQPSPLAQTRVHSFISAYGA